MKVNPDLYKTSQSGVSDKFSWNLYRFLKNHNNVRVMFYTLSFGENEKIDFDKNDTIKTPQIFIFIHQTEMIGSRLNDIMLSEHDERLPMHDYCLFDERNFIDITDWFLTEYLKSGRCMFDRSHTGWWNGDEERFTSINKKSRRCNWCGQHHTRKIEKETVIKRHAVWVS